MNRHIGSDFDDFLREEGIQPEVEAAAVKRVIAFQVRALMKQSDLSKSELARRMETSRSAVDRLLDPDNTSVTLLTLEQVAKALGQRVRIEFEPVENPRGGGQTGALAGCH